VFKGVGRIFHAFVASRAGKAVGVFGVWPNRTFDAKFVAPSEERLVVEAFVESGCQWNAQVVEQIGRGGLSLVEVDTTDGDTVFSVYKRVMTTSSSSATGANYLRHLRSQVRSGLLARSLRRMK